MAAGPFYGFNRPGATVSDGLIDVWWRQGMMGDIKAQYDCIAAFSETDFTEDLKRIERRTDRTGCCTYRTIARRVMRWQSCTGD